MQIAEKVLTKTEEECRAFYFQKVIGRARVGRPSKSLTLFERRRQKRARKGKSLRLSRQSKREESDEQVMSDPDYSPDKRSRTPKTRRCASPKTPLSPKSG